VGLPYSALCLANNCAMQKPLDTMCGRFQKLRKRRVYLHHYTEYMDMAWMRAHHHVYWGWLSLTM